MKNIVLIGFMGTGKTTIAEKLANKLKMRYISTDELIEKSEKRAISEIFEKSGEDYFRNVESNVVRAASGEENAVIDAGGGVVLYEENMNNLKSNATVICLTADPDILMERTKRHKHRPLLDVKDQKEKISELLAKRAPFYAKADYSIDTGKLSANEVVEKIIEICKKESSLRGN